MGHVCVCKVTQLCLTLCDPMDYSPPGSSVHGILQARILEWVSISFSRGSSLSRDRTQVFCIQSDTLPSESPGKPRMGHKLLKNHQSMPEKIHLAVVFRVGRWDETQRARPELPPRQDILGIRMGMVVVGTKASMGPFGRRVRSRAAKANTSCKLMCAVSLPGTWGIFTASLEVPRMLSTL